MVWDQKFPADNGSTLLPRFKQALPSSPLREDEISSCKYEPFCLGKHREENINYSWINELLWWNMVFGFGFRVNSE